MLSKYVHRIKAAQLSCSNSLVRVPDSRISRRNPNSTQAKGVTFPILWAVNQGHLWVLVIKSRWSAFFKEIKGIKWQILLSQTSRFVVERRASSSCEFTRQRVTWRLEEDWMGSWGPIPYLVRFLPALLYEIIRDEKAASWHICNFKTATD